MSDNPESGFCLNFRMTNKLGVETQFTMRAPLLSDWKTVVVAQEKAIGDLIGNGWAVSGRPPVNQSRSEPQSKPAQSHSNGEGDFEEFQADTLSVEYDPKGQKAFKVKGGKYAKFGVRVWPEVLERDFGFDVDTIAVGNHPLDERVSVLIVDGKAKKVVGLAR